MPGSLGNLIRILNGSVIGSIQWITWENWLKKSRTTALPLSLISLFHRKHSGKSRHLHISGGYAHRFRPFTRYSGCWVLASAVAFLAIVVVILIIVVILLATVVTDTLSGLMPQGFRHCGDLLRISIWSIRDRPIGSDLWITGIKETKTNKSWSRRFNRVLPAVVQSWLTKNSGSAED